LKVRQPHILWKSAGLIIVLAILLPSVFSFIHSTQGHKHYDDCELVSDVHMHENDVDCEFDGIIFNKVAVTAFAKAYTLKQHIFTLQISSYNHFFVGQDQRTSDTRGPPVV